MASLPAPPNSGYAEDIGEIEMKRKNTKWIIGGAIIAAVIIGLSFLQLGDNLVYFYTPAEATAQAKDLETKTIKIGALVQKGSTHWDSERVTLTFLLTDLQGHEIEVTHKGPAPDLFKDGQGVVAEGRIAANGKSFVATSLLVKHSEEYKKPDAEHSMDKTLLEKSLFKN